MHRQHEEEVINRAHANVGHIAFTHTQLHIAQTQTLVFVNAISREICHLCWTQSRCVTMCHPHLIRVHSTNSMGSLFFPCLLLIFLRLRKHCQYVENEGKRTNDDVSDHLPTRSRCLQRVSLKLSQNEHKRFVGTLDLSPTAQKMCSRSRRTTSLHFCDRENVFFFFSFHPKTNVNRYRFTLDAPLV